MCCLFYWPSQLVHSQGMHASVRDRDTVMSCRREFRREWFVGPTGDVDRGEGKLQMVIRCLLEAETRTMEED